MAANILYILILINLIYKKEFMFIESLHLVQHIQTYAGF